MLKKLSLVFIMILSKTARMFDLGIVRLLNNMNSQK